MRTPDIIALLIVSILMIIAFFFWERHVINDTSRPPLIRLKLFTRAKGRLASVYFIGFMTWMGFVVRYLVLLYAHNTDLASPSCITLPCSSSKYRVRSRSELCFVLYPVPSLGYYVTYWSPILSVEYRRNGSYVSAS